MKEIKIKIDDYGYVYAEMPDGTIRQMLTYQLNPYYSNILLAHEVKAKVEAEENEDGET